MQLPNVMKPGDELSERLGLRWRPEGRGQGGKKTNFFLQTSDLTKGFSNHHQNMRHRRQSNALVDITLLTI
jgi:hypothetical protein